VRLSGNFVIRLGLCCIFKKEPITFRSVTAKTLFGLSRKEQLGRLAAVCLHNANSLLGALYFLQANGIGAFRISSGFFPRFTHPDVGYQIEDLLQRDEILAALREARRFAKSRRIRLSLHPDRFIILSSPHSYVIENSIRELEFHGILAELVGAEIINVHVGGHYGDKAKALRRFASSFKKLSFDVRKRLTVENDDLSYSVADVLPLCATLGIMPVYDAHHHRYHGDAYSVEEATEAVVAIWQQQGRLPYFHLSSPRNGWLKNIRSHADFIDVNDFPDCWKAIDCTVDIEAKAKEIAVLRLLYELRGMGVKV